MNYIITLRNNSAKVKKGSIYAEKTGLRKLSNYVYFLKLWNQDVDNAF